MCIKNAHRKEMRWAGGKGRLSSGDKATDDAVEVVQYALGIVFATGRGYIENIISIIGTHYAQNKAIHFVGKCDKQVFITFSFLVVKESIYIS